MNELSSPGSTPAPLRGRVMRLVQRHGADLENSLQSSLNAATAGARRVWHLDCDFDNGGPWSGVHTLFAQILPQLQTLAPDLVERHDYELLSVLPELRKSLKPRFATLTDLAPPTERIRLFPADRALRIVHGLIDLLAAFKSLDEPGSWVITCQSFDRSGDLCRSFFSHLVRRQGRQLELLLITIEDEPASGCAFGTAPTSTVYVAPPTLPESRPPTEEARQEALQLESSPDRNEDSFQLQIPRLIRLWGRAGQPERRLRWQHEAFIQATLHGYYADALSYAQDLLAHLDDFCGNDEQRRWNIVVKVAACYSALDRSDEALTLLQQAALDRLQNPRWIAQAHYMIAMLHARYLADKDLAQAEAHLDLGLEFLARAELPEDQRHFESVFNRNGMAFARHRQGDPAEAIELCRVGLQELEEHLGEEEHKLHRSVLRYNIAQVYAASGQLDEAWHQYTAAMAMDVNHSEYYNERGNVLFKQGRLDEAIADYERAKTLSPPYPEVFVNLGQCFRMKGDFDRAIAYFETALDLDPTQNWVWVMKAECLEEKGCLREALRDYEVALELAPHQPLVLGNRARLHYEAGSFAEALEDLNRALLLSPDTADLYQNRAIALLALDRKDEAARDLETYLLRNPQAADAGEVETTLAGLRSVPVEALSQPGSLREMEGV